MGIALRIAAALLSPRHRRSQKTCPTRCSRPSGWWRCSAPLAWYFRGCPASRRSSPRSPSGLAVVMVGAIITHLRRGERQPIVVNVVLLVLALFVAVGRGIEVMG